MAEEKKVTQTEEEKITNEEMEEGVEKEPHNEGVEKEDVSSVKEEASSRHEEDEDKEEKNPGGEINELKDRMSNLEEKIEELEGEKEDYIHKLQRLQADFVNYRKRVDKEKRKLSINAKVEFISGLLPIIDNFERALAAEEEQSEFKKGVEMIYRQLVDLLKKEGVETIPTVGESFNHNLHEAMMQVEDSEYESGMIVEELQKGYILEDKVIRPAMVKVAE